MPRGRLIAHGGGTDKHDIMLKNFLYEVDRRHPRIGIVTTATAFSDEVGDDYKDAFEGLGVDDITVFSISTREEANDADRVEKLKEMDGIIFSGGDQLKLSSILGGTKFLETVKDKYEHDYFVIGGTSAGAASMSGTMILKGSSEDSLIKGELKLSSGLGFIQNVMIDTHFTERGRFGRLIQAVAHNPSVLGVGLGEDTGAIIIDDNEIEIIGNGFVIIVDGSQIKNSNITEIPDGEPLSIENVIIHVLNDRDKFYIKDRTLKLVV